MVKETVAAFGIDTELREKAGGRQARQLIAGVRLTTIDVMVDVKGLMDRGELGRVIYLEALC